MIRIAIIGTGRMAHGHAETLNNLRGVKLAACCDINQAAAEAFAQKNNIPVAFTDPAAMFKQAKLDAVSIVASDAAHAPLAIAALKAGMHVVCEKPMATSLAEARKMLKVAQKSGRMHMIHFTKRNAPALEAARKYIQAGKIGRVLHVEAAYYQGWLAGRNYAKATPQSSWRLITALGSAGVLGDLGCHVYDMAGFLCGDIAEIGCRLATFPKGVHGERLDGYKLDANDSFVATLRFASGAIGTLHSTRWATGHANREYITVYGDRGAIEVDFERSTDRIRTAEVGVNKAKQDWTERTCPPVPSLLARFAKAIRTGKPDPCDFVNGLKVQAYLDASLASDRQGGAPVRVRVR